MSNVINGGTPPRLLPLDGASASGGVMDSSSSQSRARNTESDQPAALSDFSDQAQTLATMVNRLKAMAPAVRSGLVAELKRNIAAGAYNPDAEKVAEAVAKGLANG
jgi:flagellar biosynthesis anti-sigma factor FlgM